MSAAPDIFLSYNREDAATAKLYADAFAGEGLEVWWDATLRSGEAYDEVTEAALRGAKAVVVLWSPRSVVSRWVRAEATLADRNRTLVPARIEPCDLPIMFELTQTADLAHWRGEPADPTWMAFLKDVKGIAGSKSAPAPDPLNQAITKPALRELRPSIAVLPFINRSGRSEDDIFAEGMVEDITVALTLSRRMKVIAASATAAYGSGVRDLREIGHDLGVRYLLEGNTRRIGDDLRVSAQLVEAENGDILWTQKFDRPLSEVAALQEELAGEVAAHLGVQVDRAEMEQALRKPGDISAWEAVLRALAKLGQGTMQNIPSAVTDAERAVELDPEYDHGHAVLAMALGLQYSLRGSRDARLLERAQASIARAQETASSDPLVLARIAAALNFLGRVDDALNYAQRAVSLNPNLEIPRIALGTTLHKLGRWDEAIAQFETTDDIAPKGPWMAPTMFFRANAHLCAGRPDRGLDYAERALVIFDTEPCNLVKALCEAETGHFAGGCATLGRLRVKRPELTIEIAEMLVRDPICAGLPSDAAQQFVEQMRKLWATTEPHD